MNKDNRISALPSAIKLSALELNPFPSQFVDTGSEDEDVLFLIAKAGEKNEKINFKNLKSSIFPKKSSCSKGCFPPIYQKRLSDKSADNPSGISEDRTELPLIKSSMVEFSSFTETPT